MTNFANAAKSEANFTLTENSAVALKSTESALLDLFAKVGAMRTKEYDEVSYMFQRAFDEDKLLATKLMFYARNVRGGLGERELFRKMLRSLATTHPEIVIKNMELIPYFGRFDDLYSLVGTKAENEMWSYLAYTIIMDTMNMKENKPVSLCAKWLKSINTSSKQSVLLGKMTAKQFHMDEREYRKALSQLRAYINVAERNMSAKEWDKIVYSQVPSRAMKNYRKAFQSHDPMGFAKYIENVTKGVEKINSATLYPYDILEAGGLRYTYEYRTGHFVIKNDPVLEAQWKALPNYVEGEHNILVMADTSGSMEGRPMATSIGLAIYFAERNKGAYKDLFLTFSETPEFIHLKGNTLFEKVKCVESIVANTNLEAAMDLILKVAIENNVPQEEMPKSLIVISDMHFDAATSHYGRSLSGKKTFHQSMKDKFIEHGYTMPTIVYWNVDERASAMQAKANDENVILVSGQSTSTFKSVLGNVGKTPYEFMVETLSDSMYDKVAV